jgi:hypothetical protein
MRKLLALALLSVSAFAADITGTWTAAVELGDGNGIATFVLKQSGDQLSGTYSGALGTAPVKGTVKGEKVDWTFESSDAGKITYSGTLSGASKMKGTVEYGELGKGTFTAEKKP